MEEYNSSTSSPEDRGKKWDSKWFKIIAKTTWPLELNLGRNMIRATWPDDFFFFVLYSSMVKKNSNAYTLSRVFHIE